MDQKQSDVLTILHLIKSEGEKTRKELETKMTEGFSKQQKALTKELKEYIEDKVETLRRNIVDEVQNFQDAVITEVREIRQETAVNTSHRKILTDHETRLTKVEKRIFSN